MDNTRSLSGLRNLLARGEALGLDLDALRREHDALVRLYQVVASPDTCLDPHLGCPLTTDDVVGLLDGTKVRRADRERYAEEIAELRKACEVSRAFGMCWALYVREFFEIRAAKTWRRNGLALDPDDRINWEATQGDFDRPGGFYEPPTRLQNAFQAAASIWGILRRESVQLPMLPRGGSLLCDMPFSEYCYTDRI